MDLRATFHHRAAVPGERLVIEPVLTTDNCRVFNILRDQSSTKLRETTKSSLSSIQQPE